MSTTQDLIRAIEAGNSRTAASVFEELTQARVYDAIEQRRVEIAQNMFGTVTESKEELDETFEISEESLHEMADEDFYALVENYEQLDELSKGTLARYVKNAHHAGGMASFRQGKALGNAGAFHKKPNRKEADKEAFKADKREGGIHNALTRLAK